MNVFFFSFQGQKIYFLMLKSSLVLRMVFLLLCKKSILLAHTEKGKLLSYECPKYGHFRKSQKILAGRRKSAKRLCITKKCSIIFLIFQQPMQFYNQLFYIYLALSRYFSLSHRSIFSLFIIQNYPLLGQFLITQCARIRKTGDLISSRYLFRSDEPIKC